jgi:hypothetical protein
MIGSLVGVALVTKVTAKKQQKIELQNNPLTVELQSTP